ncbi:hypothetical protein [Aeromonas sp. FDAARGOS 1408]|uniref:hypothetical protein n=1 Tax=Aeromonas TaxID=642 RepID=UPI0020B2A707|nr:hypothetical protein [Aeromonas sp. FDAARGOS 1408]
MWARVEENEVKELTGVDPEGRYHESMTWVPCDDGVQIGWMQSASGFAPITESSIDDEIVAKSIQFDLLNLSNQSIAILKPAVEGGYAKPEHTQLLADWQRYRYELTLVPEQAGWPLSHQLPEQPASVI